MMKNTAGQSENIFSERHETSWRHLTLLSFIYNDEEHSGTVQRHNSNNRLGTTEYRWHTPSNGKSPFASIASGTFNNEPANGEALPGVGVGGATCSLVPLEKMALLPCSPKTKSWFSMFPVPQKCLCSPVPLIFRPLFPWKNALVPQNPGRASMVEVQKLSSII